jgi:hypothetical protein
MSTARTLTNEFTLRVANFVLLGAVTAACASSGSSATSYIAPTLQTVTVHLDAATGSEDADLIVVDNRSTVPINVTSVTLHGCTNIRQLCDQPYKMKERVDGGSQRTIMRVSRSDPYAGSQFSYNFSWQADSGNSIAVLSVLSQAGAKDADTKIEVIKHSEEVRRREVGFADIDLPPAEIARLGDQIVSLRAEPDSLVMVIGATMFVPQVRILAIGANGEPLGRMRDRYQFRLQPGPVRFTAPDTLTAVATGRADMSIQYPTPTGSTRSGAFAPVHVLFIVR